MLKRQDGAEDEANHLSLSKSFQCCFYDTKAFGVDICLAIN